MASQEFTVLYTHQKMKKSKTWQDGILRITTGRNKAILFDDKGQCLESIFVKSQVNAGDNLEGERYLITVEAVKLNEKSFEDQPRKAEAPAVNRNGVKPGVLPPRHLSVGLKRKFTGFQGPRQVGKKILAMEDGLKSMTLPLSKQCQGTLSSKFYVTSPLFSTVSKKDTETNMFADFHEDVCMGNDTEHMSVSSLLSAPFLDRCEKAEKQNSDQSIVKPEPSQITGDTKSSSQTAGHRAASGNIRSTAQIIALLKSKPTQGCREQTPAVTECLSRFQASGNTGSLHKSTILHGFSGNSAKRLMQNIQDLPFTKGTVNDKKEWNAEMLLNSSEQPCVKEVTRHDKEADNLSHDLQDPCNTNSCFLPESIVSRMSDSQFVLSSGDVSCSASPITSEKKHSRYRGRSVTSSPKEDSSVKLQSELQPRQNPGEPSDLQLSEDLTLTETGIVKEELSTHGKDCGLGEQMMEVNFSLLEAFDFNDTNNEDLCERDVSKLTEGGMLSQSPDCLTEDDVAQNAALRLHSCCQVVTHSKNGEVKCSTSDGENDGNPCAGVMPSQLCDSDVGDTGTIAEDSANQTRFEVELLDDGCNIKEINEGQLNTEGTNKKDLDGCAVCTVNGMSQIKSKHSDLFPGDVNVNECHPKLSTFEKTGSISCISTSRITSAVDKKTEDDVIQLGCLKSPDVDLERFWGTKTDDIKPGSPLLALSQNLDPSYGSFQYIADHQDVFGVSHREDALISRSSVCPLGKGHSSLHETEIDENDFESLESINASQEACKGERIGTDCLKCMAMADNSSDLPDLVNNITLLRALTQHSTALESLQKIEENNSTLYEAETSKEIFEHLVKAKAIKQFTEIPYSESIQASSGSYFDSSGLMPVVFQGHQVKGSAASEIMLRAPCSQLGWQQYQDNTEFAAERFLSPLFSSNYVLSDFRESPGSRSPHEGDIREENFEKQSNVIEESRIDQSPLALNMYSEVLPRTVSDSISHSDLRQTQWTSWEPDKVISSVELTSPLNPDSTFSPASGSGETIGDMQEPLIHRMLPTQEKSSYPGECNLSRFKRPVKTRARVPFVSLPATEKVPDAVYPTDSEEDITISELSFPNVDKVKYADLPKRKISIPTVFESHVHYKQIFKAALTEQLNIMLFGLSQRLHKALSKVDVSFYTSLKDGQSMSKESCVPLCSHMRPAKLVMVKKEGQNKGRLFYTCDAPKSEQCLFFKWIEDVNPSQIKSRPSAVLHDMKSVGTYLRSQNIALYEGCQLLVRKAFEVQAQRCSKFKKFMNTPDRFDGDSKKKLYLKLSRKEHYSFYSKDDIWVISKTLNFDPLDTFIASSAFFGPSSNNEVELLPLKGYCPSNWRSNMIVHALLVCNASGELTALRNMEEHFNPSTLPLMPYLLKMNFRSENATNRVNKRKFIPPAINLKRTMTYGPVSTEVAMELAKKMIQTFLLNPDQATSLIRIAQMMTSCENLKPVEEHQILPITIIHGVFGAGKSYLLSVVILFLVQLFESSEATKGPRPAQWKLLIASSTNVAIDRILQGLLDLGFEDFIRVGSIRKITKAILPHSLHAGSGNDNEQLKELLALMKEDLTPTEKMYVRKSIEQHKLGTNKTILQQVKVVGVTCAACPFPCLNALKFPVVMLDECSQITEPASLLPIARFQCEKLVLVGDPKQLPPTIQGSESVHEKGLEQTLFDRLCLMGHKTILLRTQYRCHPAISAIANELFYEGNLIDGVSEKDRSPLLDWLPTLCFYNVNGVEQIERDNSFYNMAEVHFAVKLIQALVASGIKGSAIGLITLYKSQMCKTQNLVSDIHSEAFELKAVQVSTVDAFQGAEKEIIVLSCVRTRQIGFIDSEKRMNVALTRAKRHLLIVGNLACLSRNRLWGRVIHHCKGWENGLQHASQCEQQLNEILTCYLEKREEEAQKN
ncbi:protein ZGRF1 isoform X8 [Falco biarmicus]|uniref:protein ZGRF1 isoform X8 n=1 Tax=Falco biarmicus TaxID=345155 RepID=UPI0024BCA1EF|nr:protein ZGRF1 isoform X8 [Falco biarmicus]